MRLAKMKLRVVEVELSWRQVFFFSLLKLNSAILYPICISVLILNRICLYVRCAAFLIHKFFATELNKYHLIKTFRQNQTVSRLTWWIWSIMSVHLYERLRNPCDASGAALSICACRLLAVSARLSLACVWQRKHSFSQTTGSIRSLCSQKNMNTQTFTLPHLQYIHSHSVFSCLFICSFFKSQANGTLVAAQHKLNTHKTDCQTVRSSLWL